VTSVEGQSSSPMTVQAARCMSCSPSLSSFLLANRRYYARGRLQHCRESTRTRMDSSTSIARLLSNKGGVSGRVEYLAGTSKVSRAETSVCLAGSSLMSLLQRYLASLTRDCLSRYRRQQLDRHARMIKHPCVVPSSHPTVLLFQHRKQVPHLTVLTPPAFSAAA
jgi:hypothetical protein